MAQVVVSGAINWDINLYVERFPQPGEEVTVSKLIEVPGGTGANVAVASARILGRGKVAFLGALGDDEIAKKQLEILEIEGVITSGVKIVRGEMSGQAYIVIDSTGENVIHTYFGANKLFTPEDLNKPNLKRLVEEAKVSVLMDPPIETIERLLEICKSSGTVTVWDPGALVERSEEIYSMLDKTDYIILNSVEVSKLFGTMDPVILYAKLREFSNLHVIVKYGKKGSALIDIKDSKLIRVTGVPLEKLNMKTVNTVGCGDAFTGAFSSFKSMGADDEKCLVMANCAGAFKATKIETRGSPTYAELIEFYEKAKPHVRVETEYLA